MDVVLTIDQTAAVARLDPTAAPKTCAALADVLPFTATIHLAKIAGYEFYCHMPLLLEVEHRRHVAELVEGAVAFWPERQLLCVYYGATQQEDTSVTWLGAIVENLSGLTQAAESIRPRLGRAVATVHLQRRNVLAAPDARAPTPAEPRSGLALVLYDAYASIRQAWPPEVAALLRRRGVMQPAGPLVCGEAEARKLHEFLWLLRKEILTTGAVSDFAGIVLEQYANRLQGWYGLPQTGALVREVAVTLPRIRGDEARTVIEGLILYVGRLSLWLDACIPWDGINTLLQESPPLPDVPPAGEAGKRGHQ